MRIIIETIPHSAQRYGTLGDWIPCGNDLLVYVSETGDDRMNMLIAIHELIEAELCTQRGIAEADVTAFDVAHLDDDDPGANESAPYHAEHMFADSIERLICAEMGIDWAAYEATLEAVQ